jgi:hypothetical protein
MEIVIIGGFAGLNLAKELLNQKIFMSCWQNNYNFSALIYQLAPYFHQALVILFKLQKKNLQFRRTAQDCCPWRKQSHSAQWWIIIWSFSLPLVQKRAIWYGECKENAIPWKRSMMQSICVIIKKFRKKRLFVKIRKVENY